MYQGTNPSALRSRDWLCRAMLRLMESNQYEQITIKEICREADLSRQTFYQIFNSKEEVMAYHFEQLFGFFSKEHGNFANTSVRELTRHFFSFFFKQREFVRELIDNHLTHILEQQFEVYLPRIDLFVQKNLSVKYPEYSTAFIAGALTQILVHWHRQHYELTIEELSVLTEALIQGLHID